MSAADPSDLSKFSMLELFRMETQTQKVILTDGLLALERDPASLNRLEELMRAAHSLKGAARIVDLRSAVRVAHLMEDCFIAAQKGQLILRPKQIDVLLAGTDLLTKIAETSESEIPKWEREFKNEVDAFLALLSSTLEQNDKGPSTQSKIGAPEIDGKLEIQRETSSEPALAGRVVASQIADPEASSPFPARNEIPDHMLRVTADSLNRLLAFAGESMVESRRLKPLIDSLSRLQRHNGELSRLLDGLRESSLLQKLDERLQNRLFDAQHKAIECRGFLSQRLAELEAFDHRSSVFSRRLYTEALACRMRPLTDGVQSFPRMVRDMARSLGKEAKMELIGEATSVDRDILDKLKAPLTHLLRNAVDHGIETPDERRRSGKPIEGTVCLEARHSAGMLLITVTDDGKGIDPLWLREAIVRKQLTTAEVAERMSETELLEFLLLPGFTMKETVTEISGRGIGLDIVQSMVKKVRGTMRVSSRPGKGMQFQLQLPLTTSVVRTLLVDIAGEPYAFPLASINRTLKLPKEKIETLEGRPRFELEGRQIGVVTAHQILDRGEPSTLGDEFQIIVLEEETHCYGVIVDRFLGQKELVIQALDPRLGKIRNISAGSFMEDGSPVLIVDVEDFKRAIEKLVSGGRLKGVQRDGPAGASKKHKCILVVDDSLTVRELERKFLGSRGYQVDVAVDGMDGWNAVRTGRYDLIISDVDMPRMDGIELVSLIKKDPTLRSLPVMIVSYKDRDEDRHRGLEAGADYYLTKGSFHDETLLEAVEDLIGEADA